MGYCLDCRNWIWLYLGLDLTIGLSCKTEQCLVSKPSVWFWDLIWMWSDCVLNSRYLASIHTGILDLATCIWYLATGTWQCFLVLSWSSSLLGSTCTFYFDTWSFSTFQLPINIVFSSFKSIYTSIFQLDSLFIGPSFWQELTRHAQFLARDAMLYYIVLEFSMNSIWIVLTIMQNKWN